MTICIAAADHPSITADIDGFLISMRAEQRYFGPTARRNPKPAGSLLDSLREPGGFRLVAVDDGSIVGVLRIDDAGELFIAVAADHRRRGIGSELARRAVARARIRGYTRLVIHTTRRAHAARRIGEQLGCVVIDRDRGRTELIVELSPGRRIA